MRFKITTFGFLFSFMAVLAQSSVAFNAAGLTAQEVAELSSKEVLSIIEAGREERRENTPELTEKILVSLEPVVDFDGIAKSVMGKYRKQASAEQIDRFARVFKETMVKLYARALITFESESITVLPAEEDEGLSKKAKVEMDVKGTDGKIYKVIYSMRKNKEGVWQARNMIVDGINLGMTYLNQFDSAMNRYENDMEAVINSWQQDMEENGSEENDIQ